MYLHTFKGMERRLQRNLPMYDSYNKFIYDDYANLKHMEKTSTSLTPNACYSLSQRFSTGVFLNELLHTGPQLKTDKIDYFSSFVFCRY